MREIWVKSLGWEVPVPGTIIILVFTDEKGEAQMCEVIRLKSN